MRDPGAFNDVDKSILLRLAKVGLVDYESLFARVVQGARYPVEDCYRHPSDFSSPLNNFRGILCVLVSRVLGEGDGLLDKFPASAKHSTKLSPPVHVPAVGNICTDAQEKS